jgi:signal transduction histidine kinase
VRVIEVHRGAAPAAPRTAPAGSRPPPRPRVGTTTASSLAAALRRPPISVRLGATFAIVFLVVLAGLSALSYWGLGRILRSELDRSLVTAAHAFETAGPDFGALEKQELAGVGSQEFDTQVIGAEGAVANSSDDDLSHRAVLSAAQLARTYRDGALFTDVVDEEGDPLRALAMPLQPGGVLVVLAELDTVESAQEGLLHLSLGLFPVAGVLAGATGWLVARRGLRPIARMTADAERISARDPFPRLAVPPTRDEVARLGTTLNRLLDRIEEGRRREREFTADASHELRTPLAVLRAELELARNRTADEAFLRSLDSALEESDRLGQLIDDLLLLARHDAGHVRAHELVDVSQVVDELMPRFRVLAGRRGITLTRTGDAVAHADRRALSRALANLLDNAVRHSAENSEVSVTVTQEPAGTAITVTDAGPGIPPEERQRLTQRFTQLDRGRAGGGAAGLGLAIVASVAAAHGGRFEMADGPSGKGLAVTLRLPSAGPGPG